MIGLIHIVIGSLHVCYVYRGALRRLMHTEVCIGLDIAHFPSLMYGFIMQQMYLLQLGLLDQRQQLCVILDNAQLPYLEAYNALFVLYNALFQMGLLFMCPIIVQPNANVYSYASRKHL